MCRAKVVKLQEHTCFVDFLGTMECNVVINEEMHSLYEKNTWELTPLPKGKKSIRCKWVYKMKRNSNGFVRHYKANMVAKRYTQTYGINFDEKFNPISKMETMRVVISMVTTKIWELQQIDVKNANLNGKLQQEVYME